MPSDKSTRKKKGKGPSALLHLKSPTNLCKILEVLPHDASGLLVEGLRGTSMYMLSCSFSQFPPTNRQCFWISF
jgi:hypothetical protein